MRGTTNRNKSTQCKSDDKNKGKNRTFAEVLAETSVPNDAIRNIKILNENPEEAKIIADKISKTIVVLTSGSLTWCERMMDLLQ